MSADNCAYASGSPWRICPTEVSQGVTRRAEEERQDPRGCVCIATTRSAVCPRTNNRSRACIAIARARHARPSKDGHSTQISLLSADKEANELSRSGARIAIRAMSAGNPRQEPGESYPGCPAGGAEEAGHASVTSARVKTLDLVRGHSQRDPLRGPKCATYSQGHTIPLLSHRPDQRTVTIGEIGSEDVTDASARIPESLARIRLRS